MGEQKQVRDFALLCVTFRKEVTRPQKTVQKAFQKKARDLRYFFAETFMSEVRL